jgi:hypothetical protein
MNDTLKKFLNLGERAGTTFLEQFFTVMLGSGAASLLVNPHWASAADRAGFAALVSIGTSLVTFGIPKLPAGVDAILRIFKTGLQVFLGDLLASSNTPSLVHADWKHALAAGVVVMGPAALKVLAALGIQSTVGASVLPATLDNVPVSAAQLNYVTPDQLNYAQPPGAVPDTAPHIEANLANVVVAPPVDPTATVIDPAELAYPDPLPAGDHAAP